MKFNIQTLVDVTETNARRGGDGIEVKQQANFMTLYNIIGLRTNPIEFNVSVEEKNTTAFGSAFKGKQRIWSVDFVVEAEDSITIDDMTSDFDLVPFISNLTETAKFDNDVFRSKDQTKINVIFKKIDK